MALTPHLPDVKPSHTAPRLRPRPSPQRSGSEPCPARSGPASRAPTPLSVRSPSAPRAAALRQPPAVPMATRWRPRYSALRRGCSRFPDCEGRHRRHLHPRVLAVRAVPGAAGARGACADEQTREQDGSMPHTSPAPRHSAVFSTRPAVRAGGRPCLRFSTRQASGKRHVCPLLLAVQSNSSGKDGRSEERRVGKECLRLCRSRWSPYH